MATQRDVHPKAFELDWNRLLSKPAFISVVSVILPSLIVLLLYGIQHPVTATIDDVRLLYVYAGYASGTPTGTYLFSNALWGGAIAKLYEMFPLVPWYLLAHFVCLAISCGIAGTLIYAYGGRTKKSLVWLLCIHALLLLAVFLDAFMILHFEVTASLIGAAGIALFFSSDDAQGRLATPLALVGSFVLVMLCLMQNKNVFYACSVFLAVAWCYRMLDALGLEDRRRKTKTMLYMVLFLACVVGGYFVLQRLNATCKGAAWESYMEYNPYRVAYSDYAHLAFDDDPELFESVGWSRSFYDVTTYKYYMDNRFSMDALSELVKPFSRLTSAMGGFSFISSCSVIINMFKESRAARIQFLFFAVLVVGISVSLARGKRSVRRRNIILAVIAASGAAIALLLYLAWRGRLPQRAWETVAFPAMSIIGVSYGKSLQLERRTDPGKCPFSALGRMLDFRGAWLVKMLAAGVIAIVVALFAGRQFALYRHQLESRLRTRARCDQTTSEVIQYAVARPDDVFVYGPYIQDYNPSKHFDSDETPLNLFPWGTSYIYTPIWEDQLAANSLKDLSSESFAESNVHLICSTGTRDTFRDAFITMLREDYGMKVRRVESHSDKGFVVLSFRRVAEPSR